MIREFSMVAEKHGCNIGLFRVEKRAEFKIRYSKDGQRLNCFVPDYLDSAPSSIIRGLAESMFLKMEGKIPSIFTHEFDEYLIREGFNRTNQKRTIGRRRGITRSVVSKNHDLGDSYDRVVSTGKVSPPDNLFLTWSMRPSLTNWGYYIPWARLLVIDSALNDPKITKQCLDSVMYHELLHAELCHEHIDRGHGQVFRSRLSEMPRTLRVRFELESLQMRMRKQRTRCAGERITDYC